MSVQPNIKVLSLYRHLLRASKAAAGSSKRGIQPLRDKVRSGFNANKTINNPEQIKEQLDRGYNTLKFLNNARNKDSAEHRIVKTIGIMHWYEQSYRLRPSLFNRKLSETRRREYENAIKEYEHTIELLNKMSGLALR